MFVGLTLFVPISYPIFLRVRSQASRFYCLSYPLVYYLVSGRTTCCVISLRLIAYVSLYSSPAILVAYSPNSINNTPGFVVDGRHHFIQRNFLAN